MKRSLIIVLKETRDGEARVALTPSAVASLIEKKYLIMIENGAGILAGFSDEKYIHAGGQIFNLDSAVFPSDSLLLRVKCPSEAREHVENKMLTSGTVMIGFLDPLDRIPNNYYDRLKKFGVTPISLELLKFSADDARDAQAAMSRFAGRLALQDALQHYQGSLPKKVTVIGTGPAGLSAALAARDLQLSVQLFGRQEHHRHVVEAAGITYCVLPTSEQNTFLRAHLSNQTIIITAARQVGKKSPLLIDATSLEILPDNAVVIDLSAGEGGNVIGSEQDKTLIVDRGITIRNISGYPKAEPKAASEAYAGCIVNLLFDIMDPVKGINLKSSLLKFS